MNVSQAWHGRPVSIRLIAAATRASARDRTRRWPWFNEGVKAGCLLAAVFLIAGVVAGFWYPLPGIAIAASGLAAGISFMKRSSAQEREQADEERRRFEAIAPASGAAWRTLLEAERVPAGVTGAVASLVRPAIRIAIARAGRVATGSSRVGGTPDVPPGFEWPRKDGTPLAFLAQIDLEEVAHRLPSSPLPADGLLWFFYDTAEEPWGFDPAHAGGSRVIYLPNPDRLALVAAPAGTPATFPLCRVEMEAYDDIPDLEPDEPPGDQMDEAAMERYVAVRAYLSSGAHGGAHKLLGHADPVQGAMELGCEMVSAGINVGDGYPERARTAAVEAAARSWRLLLQIDSDEEASMQWGDAGILYFWIRAEDLAARRFDRVHTILQCH